MKSKLAIEVAPGQCQQGGSEGSEGDSENQVGSLRKVWGAEGSKRGMEVWKGCRKTGKKIITVSA